MSSPNMKKKHLIEVSVEENIMWNLYKKYQHLVFSLGIQVKI